MEDIRDRLVRGDLVQDVRHLLKTGAADHGAERERRAADAAAGEGVARDQFDPGQRYRSQSEGGQRADEDAGPRQPARGRSRAGLGCRLDWLQDGSDESGRFVVAAPDPAYPVAGALQRGGVERAGDSGDCDSACASAAPPSSSP